MWHHFNFNIMIIANVNFPKIDQTRLTNERNVGFGFHYLTSETTFVYINNHEIIQFSLGYKSEVYKL